MSAAQRYITLTYEFHKEGNVWVGVCKETGTATSHKSINELEKQLKELVGLHLNCLEELGERERFFKENKIKIREVKPIEETIRLPVPDDVFIQTRVHRLPAMAGTCGN
jgi:predicted RNase H-like HicB family nuclease